MTESGREESYFDVPTVNYQFSRKDLTIRKFDKGRKCLNWKKKSIMRDKLLGIHPITVISILIVLIHNNSMDLMNFIVFEPYELYQNLKLL